MVHTMSDTGRPLDGHGHSDLIPQQTDGAASGHLCSQAVLESQIILLASEIHHGPCDAPWTVSTAHCALSTSLSKRSPAEIHLIRLLTQYNAHAPINLLPSEIFSEILFQIINDVMAVTFREIGRASIVCAYWRQAVLSYPLLWTNIDLFQEKYAALALERSHAAPLNLTLSPLRMRTGDTEENYTYPISDHASRIASLDLSQPCYSHAALFGIFPPSLPLLHTLSLDTMDLPFDAAEMDRALLRDTSIAHSAMPALRQLELEGLSLPWTLPLFRGLVHLQVRLTNESYLMNVSTFRDVLAACPGLEVLWLRNVGPDPADRRASDAAEPVSLPKLDYVHLEYFTSNGIACATLVLKIIPTLTSAENAMISGSMSTSEDSTMGFLWYRTASGLSTLRIANGWDSSMRRLLRVLPTVRVADFSQRAHESLQSISVARNLRAMLADLHMEQLERFETWQVPRGAIVEALRDQENGPLKKLRIATAPGSTDQERAGHIELLKDFVEELVDCDTFFWAREESVRAGIYMA
ncbi:hypothetical protein DENSPDRAFT_560362 [Dentipellis sp. KUC8613]|nr:hypothetical protein DENSPDRAFT_560362 [Dentipellis sp. KUC8613]